MKKSKFVSESLNSYVNEESSFDLDDIWGLTEDIMSKIEGYQEFLMSHEDDYHNEKHEHIVNAIGLVEGEIGTSLDGIDASYIGALDDEIDWDDFENADEDELEDFKDTYDSLTNLWNKIKNLPDPE